MNNFIYSQKLTHGEFRVYPERPDFLFHEVKQVHGIDCSYPTGKITEADALINNYKDSTALAIKTADCLPVVFEGEKEVVFLHAGWRGLALGILNIEQIKNIKPVKAFIGPAIHQCCFEVGADFNNLFPEIKVSSKSGKNYADLIGFSLDKIKTIFPDISVEEAGICTMCNQLFHSYRRDKTIKRNYNLYFSKDI
jgi:copper oxidase (laccase) domain-containing protein